MAPPAGVPTTKVTGLLGQTAVCADKDVVSIPAATVITAAKIRKIFLFGLLRRLRVDSAHLMKRMLYPFV
jgi:hypothetical protein